MAHDGQRVGSAIGFEDRGAHELKGLTEPRHVYQVAAEG
jgi:hypothetical protein